MKQKSRSLAAFCFAFIRKQPIAFFLIQIGCLGWAIDALVWPYVVKLFIDTFVEFEKDRIHILSHLLSPIFLAMGVWLWIEASFRMAGVVTAFAYPKLEAEVRMSMFSYVQGHSYDYFTKNFAGAISNKISDMTLSLSRILSTTQWVFVPVLFTLTISIILFTMVQPLFGLILGSWIVIHMGTAIYFSKECDQKAHVHAESRSHLVGRIVDSFSNHINVRLFARNKFENQFLSRFQDDEKIKHKRALMSIEKMKFFLGIFAFIGPGLLINGTIIYSFREGLISTGDAVFIFNATANVMLSAWFAGLEIPNLFREVGTCRQAYRLIEERHGLQDAVNAKSLEIQKGDILFDRVTFSYSEGKTLFKDLSLHIRAGEKVGLVGFSGSGKTTFAHLILRYYDIKEGRILVDGHDIRDITTESLRRNIALIPQDPALFHRTIFENIAYGDPSASEEAVIEASIKAHAHDFIQKMGEKYQTLVGERGIKLSGGQRQRIAIARAILKNAPILILDEATSALDSVTEKLIQESLSRLMENKTCLVVAHRLSTLSDMDRIVVFDGGKIVEEGTHAQLIEQGGHFARMWEMQAGGFLPEWGDEEIFEEEESLDSPA